MAPSPHGRRVNIRGSGVTEQVFHSEAARFVNGLVPGRDSVMLRSRSLVLALAAGSTLPAAAHATVLNYASAVSGTASTAARWAPAQVPVAADDLVFNATAGTQAYSVTFDAITATSRTMVFNEDTVTLSMSANHTTTNGVAIGDVAVDVATVSLTSGTWNSGPSGFVNVGDAASSTGTLNVTGSAAHFGVLGTSDLFVGNNGTGTLNITGTGDVTCNDLMFVGQGSAATGNLTVSGFLSIAPFGVSSLTVNGAGESRWGNGGDATVSIANGGQAHFLGSLVVGTLSTSLANVTVGGSGFVTGATLDVDGDLSIGRNPTAALVPGTGTMTVNSDGNVLVGGTLHLGDDPDGGSGTLNINTSATVDAVNVVDGTFGTINHNGGTLKINGGTYTGHAVPLVVSGTGSPTVQYSANSVNTLTAVGGVGLKVGDDLGAGSFSGNLIIDSGADIVMSGLNNDINIGDDTGTTGVVTVTGAGSRLIDNQPGDLIRVGFNGIGNLVVDSGGQVLATEIQVPASSVGGTGGLVMNNPANGGPIVTTENLSVGNAAGMGTGTVTINNGDLNVTNPGVGVVVRDTGVLTVPQSGTLNTTGTINIDGGRLLLSGNVHAGVLVDVLAGGELSSTPDSGAALVDGPVRVRSGGTVKAILGNLTIGDNTDPGGVIFDSGSTVTVGSGRTLTLLDSFTADADGRIDLQGGTITSSQTLRMDAPTATDQLVGFGTIDADVLAQSGVGQCAPSGTGLNFLRGLIMNGGFNAAGTTMHFAPGASLRDVSVAPNTLACKVVMDAGSEIRPQIGNTAGFGPVTMGDGTSTGVTLNGVIHLGTNGSLTLNDTFSANLGTLTDMNGGSITNTTGLNLPSGRILRGHGAINVGPPTNTGLQVNSGGTIDPDAYFSDTDTYHGIGRFSVDGRYAQAVGGNYLCEIAGFDNEFQPLNDRIDAGPVTLAGTLNVSLIDGYVPQQCHEFTILTYTSRTGTWTNIIQPPGANVGVRYEATRAVLFFNSVGCDDIDYNNDGLFPDTADIDDFLSVFSGGSCSTGTCSDIDFNNDCLFPDTTDIDSLLTVFSGGPCL